MTYQSLAVDTILHWVAVVVYVIASVTATYGVLFKKSSTERKGFLIAGLGLAVHGIALVFRWYASGHGPYMTRYEVLSADTWIMLCCFFVFCRFFPKIRAACIFIFPSSFLLIALSLFFNPAIKKLPPSLRSVWLLLHVLFYKIAVGTFLIGLAFGLFYILRRRTRFAWLDRLPDSETIDLLSYRFASFGFTFWAIGMLAGSIWAYESWGRYWGWDPIEIWSLISWIAFGIYLHLRRFFGWDGERAGYLYLLCFILSVVAAFFVSVMDSSIHAEYFK